MSYFQDLLKQTGHVYPDYESNHVTELRHAYVLVQGDIVTGCGKIFQDVKRGVGCPGLWPDVNCPVCRATVKPKSALTKRRVLTAIVDDLINIEQLFLDAAWWNVNNADKPPLNPDPDGQLAATWSELNREAISILDRMRGLMEDHYNKFGWPENVDVGGDS